MNMNKRMNEGSIAQKQPSPLLRSFTPYKEIFSMSIIVCLFWNKVAALVCVFEGGVVKKNLKIGEGTGRSPRLTSLLFP